MKSGFWELFKENEDATLSPVQQIRIGMVTLNSASCFGRGVQICGIDLHAVKGRDVEGDEIDGVFVIRGFY